MVSAQPLHDALFGLEVERGSARASAVASIERASRAIARLDGLVERDDLFRIWQRYEAVVGAVAAMREAGAAVDLAAVIRSAATGVHDCDGAISAVLARLEPRQRPSQRRTLARLSSLVAPSRQRGGGTLLELADRIARASATASSPILTVSIHASARVASVARFDADGHDLADIAQITPLALQRAGLTTALLPSLTARPRALIANLEPLDRLSRWLDALAEQAVAAEHRLIEVRTYMTGVERRLVNVRRPQALRRAVRVCLENGATWAARLAAVTNTDIASAWRTLAQAEERGILVPIPGPRRSRGNARVLTAPPIARAAGLAAPARTMAREAPRAAASDDVSEDAVAAFDATLAEVDALLARYAARAGGASED